MQPPLASEIRAHILLQAIMTVHPLFWRHAALPIIAGEAIVSATPFLQSSCVAVTRGLLENVSQSMSPAAPFSLGLGPGVAYATIDSLKAKSGFLNEVVPPAGVAAAGRRVQIAARSGVFGWILFHAHGVRLGGRRLHTTSASVLCSCCIVSVVASKPLTQCCGAHYRAQSTMCLLLRQRTRIETSGQT